MFARTDRLLLRPGWSEDAPALFDAIRDKRIVRNLAQAPWPYTMADAETFLARNRSPVEPACLIFLRTSGSPLLVGCVGLGRLETGGYELGYWIAAPFWGRGYATEAARAVVDHALHALRLPSLSAGHFVDNPASGRVLGKLGFAATGDTVRRYSAGRGAPAPCRLFAIRGPSERGEARLAA